MPIANPREEEGLYVCSSFRDHATWAVANTYTVHVLYDLSWTTTHAAGHLKKKNTKYKIFLIVGLA